MTRVVLYRGRLAILTTSFAVVASVATSCPEPPALASTGSSGRTIELSPGEAVELPLHVVGWASVAHDSAISVSVRGIDGTLPSDAGALAPFRGLTLDLFDATGLVATSVTTEAGNLPGVDIDLPACRVPCFRRRELVVRITKPDDDDGTPLRLQVKAGGRWTYDLEPNAEIPAGDFLVVDLENAHAVDVGDADSEGAGDDAGGAP